MKDSFHLNIPIMFHNNEIGRIAIFNRTSEDFITTETFEERVFNQYVDGKYLGSLTKKSHIKLIQMTNINHKKQRYVKLLKLKYVEKKILTSNENAELTEYLYILSTT